MKILYNYYYLFYTRVLPDDEPFATTLFTLTVSESFAVDFIIRYFLAVNYCKEFQTSSSMFVFGVMLVVNYLIFHRGQRARKFVAESPKFFGSHKLSIIITVIFFLITSSTLFLGPVYISTILDDC
jgi:hypothetical protein